MKKQQTASKTKQIRVRPLLFALFAAAMTYVFASWAIDSGSLWVYLFTAASFYYTVDFALKFGKQFVTHEHTRKKRKARRA